MNQTSYQEDVQILRIQRIIKNLQKMNMFGTSAVSLYIPPNKMINESIQKINNQYNEASQIQDKVNRQAVQESLLATIQILKGYQKSPSKGLVIFCGFTKSDQETTNNKISYCIEPPRKLEIQLFFCDSVFHTSQLANVLSNDPIIGFVVMDGSQTLFAKVQGNSKEIIKQFYVNLPKKHNKGGQSSVRFARIREYKRQNYLRKVCEYMNYCFLSEDKLKVKGLVLAGSADFKNQLTESQILDQRLQSVIITTVDVQYGGEQGLNEALRLSQEELFQMKIIKEKNIVSSFFDQLAQNTNKIIYGVQDTIRAFDQNLIEKLICVDSVEQQRVECLNLISNSQTTLITNQFEDFDEGDEIDYKNEKLKILSKNDLLEYLIESSDSKGVILQLISNKSVEGYQFAKGFGGVGGFLRFEIEQKYIQSLNSEYLDDDEEFI